MKERSSPWRELYEGLRSATVTLSRLEFRGIAEWVMAQPDIEQHSTTLSYASNEARITAAWIAGTRERTKIHTARRKRLGDDDPAQFYLDEV